MTAPAPAGDWPPGRRRRRCSWVPTVAITRGTLQYRVPRAFRRAGIDADRARGALVHGLRHTYATSSNADVSVYTPDETARPRVHGDLTAQRHRGAGGGYVDGVVADAAARENLQFGCVIEHLGGDRFAGHDRAVDTVEQGQRLVGVPRPHGGGS